mmetsp:Transcript_29537/g.43554  ORF Transcript_29537/g.43554 Transcript_29537/m.43554 type:complete len:104 (-) Transcript_29537:188-499(-)
MGRAWERPDHTTCCIGVHDHFLGAHVILDAFFHGAGSTATLSLGESPEEGEDVEWNILQFFPRRWKSSFWSSRCWDDSLTDFHFNSGSQERLRLACCSFYHFE